MPKKANTQKARTQDLIPIKKIENGVVTLSDGSLRKVILVDGINFDLKSEGEQKIIIGAYQSLINSLDFSLQTNVHSRKLNVEGYLEGLKEKEKNEKNPLIRTQIEEYSKFVGQFVGENAIMSKSFFITVPYTPVGLPGAKGSTISILDIFNRKKGEAESKEDQQNTAHVEQLEQRVEQILGGLRQIGLRAIPLEDAELVELYFNTYNPTAIEKRGSEAGKKFASDPSANIANLIAPPSMEVKNNYLKVGDKLSKTLFVFNYPRYLATGWLSSIINMPELVDVGGGAGSLRGSSRNVLTERSDPGRYRLHPPSRSPSW